MRDRQLLIINMNANGSVTGMLILFRGDFILRQVQEHMNFLIVYLDMCLHIYKQQHEHVLYFIDNVMSNFVGCSSRVF